MFAHLSSINKMNRRSNQQQQILWQMIMNLLLQSYFCFFASRGFYTNMSFDIINFMDTSSHEWINQQKAIYISNLRKIYKNLGKKLYQQHTKVNQDKRLDIVKRSLIILEIKSSHLQRTSTLTDHQKNQTIRCQFFLISLGKNSSFWNYNSSYLSKSIMFSPLTY